MTEESLTPWVSIVVVLVGLVILLTGVGVYHDYTIQAAGGAIGLLGFGLLTAYIAKL